MKSRDKMLEAQMAKDVEKITDEYFLDFGMVLNKVDKLPIKSAWLYGYQAALVICYKAEIRDLLDKP